VEKPSRYILMAIATSSLVLAALLRDGAQEGAAPTAQCRCIKKKRRSAFRTHRSIPGEHRPSDEDSYLSHPTLYDSSSLLI
jgi:hypothetical protein